MNLLQVKGFGQGVRPKLPSTALPQPEIFISWFRALRTGLGACQCVLSANAMGECPTLDPAIALAEAQLPPQALDAAQIVAKQQYKTAIGIWNTNVDKIWLYFLDSLTRSAKDDIGEFTEVAFDIQPRQDILIRAAIDKLTRLHTGEANDLQHYQRRIQTINGEFENHPEVSTDAAAYQMFRSFGKMLRSLRLLGAVAKTGADLRSTCCAKLADDKFNPDTARINTAPLPETLDAIERIWNHYATKSRRFVTPTEGEDEVTGKRSAAQISSASDQPIVSSLSASSSAAASNELVAQLAIENAQLKQQLAHVASPANGADINGYQSSYSSPSRFPRGSAAFNGWGRQQSQHQSPQSGRYYQPQAAPSSGYYQPSPTPGGRQPTGREYPSQSTGGGGGGLGRGRGRFSRGGRFSSGGRSGPYDGRWQPTQRRHVGMVFLEEDGTRTVEEHYYGEEEQYFEDYCEDQQCFGVGVDQPPLPWQPPPPPSDTPANVFGPY